VDRPAPLSREDLIAALRETPRREEKSARLCAASDDKGALLSLANHVAIGAQTPGDIEEEVSSLERATTEPGIARWKWKKMSEPAQRRWVARTR
jgi:hypothetical protein